MKHHAPPCFPGHRTKASRWQHWSHMKVFGTRTLPFALRSTIFLFYFMPKPKCLTRPIHETSTKCVNCSNMWQCDDSIWFQAETMSDISFPIGTGSRFETVRSLFLWTHQSKQSGHIIRRNKYKSYILRNQCSHYSWNQGNSGKGALWNFVTHADQPVIWWPLQ